MKTILHKLARIGLREDLNPYEAKRIQVFNYSNLFGFIASLTRIIYISFFSVTHYTELTVLVNMLPLALCIVMGTCMYYQKYKTATYLSFLCFPPVILMMYVSTHDSSVSFFMILYFIFPFFFLNRPKNIIAAFMITVCCYLAIQFAGAFHLLFYSESFYKYDAVLNYIDIGLSLTFIFSSLYAIKFMVWAYQRSITRKKQELKELNQFKDKMFSIISHDLRSPIAATSQLIDLLADIPMEQNEFRLYLSELKGQVNNARELMDNMLVWARRQMENQAIVADETKLHEIVDETFLVLNNQAVNKQVQLINDTTPAHIAFADKDMIRVVVRNLLSNAIKFTRNGGYVKVRTSITDAKQVLFEIEDNGIGIPVAKQPMVLGSEYFTSYGTANEKGSGLGLKICREFIEKNNGSITFKSEEGEGTVFSITLPMFKADTQSIQLYSADSLQVKPGFYTEAKFAS